MQMILRDWVHAAGRVLTRGLLYPRWRYRRSIAWTYLQLYLVGKRLTERGELTALRALIKPGMVIADIGANVGFYTMEMASSVGPTGRILAFEPDPFSFSLLQLRIKRAGTGNVEAYQFALGDKTGRAVLYCSAYNRADNRLSKSHREPNVEMSEVQVCALDEFMSTHTVETLDGLKIDVQGAEEQVLQGAQATLGRGLQWIWIEFSPEHLRGAGTDPERLLKLIGDLGMDIFEINRAGCLQALSSFEGYTRRIDSGYTDLVLLPRAAVARIDGDA
jgi:FkbM family methyltransferase